MSAKEKLLLNGQNRSLRDYLEKNPAQKELSATRPGRLRMEIKKYLVKEMQEINKLVEK